ncbi:dTDP-4-dehydrorhamnose 3,5-epimerase [Xanthomonas hortorum pv. vitians]|uniref:dTDP-4-dehydrorhamnose 3,5-epimerase n=1 Tax=Xanthomonas hortorum TaxID=56454 RepID=UPI00093869E9|nr:dTDP-4-dehydrorhamnose 3,5-epimerase [Xanthomonas hortorum]APP84870.1 dTDP-4-dehydrorhamnose 3,5-epimerase [Xanthomonas hortorum pv. gardneri]ASW45176.1 dTDP-4-dehydrorhamnose 3,5-epimerase [Xanthomonas hortorum]MCC8495941.1 dTDP-4-dehydrorhamnose 3,5-epimerase [Xanthomonas hortorum pv. gardneri]MCE4280536.1 dTDP-4-dehydrorhamnose 3,5-epimerase [Xanthomonas hortorum pv. vitians]MCE4286658.1 dTDP-4-dehydrorhamnose 3,5-epimerase [Xanthomonas hortorum pv. vitians]
MIFHPTPLAGAFVIEPEQRGDARGWFARVFCTQEMAQAGLVDQFVQVNNSFNAQAGTLRGMHYQLPPAAEVKIVRCIRGALWDAIVDLRPDSRTYLQWYGTELTAENRLALYVPRGFAHGFITLQPQTEAFYFANAMYTPQAERGLRWNDPRLGLQWPLEPQLVSDKDAAWPDFNEHQHGIAQLAGLTQKERA